MYHTKISLPKSTYLEESLVYKQSTNILILTAALLYFVKASAEPWLMPAKKSLEKQSIAIGYNRAINKSLYVCSANLWGSKQLGLTWRAHKKCTVPYAGKIYSVDNFSLLNKIKLNWQPYYGFAIKGSVVLGEGVKKVPLFLCRGYYHRSLLAGKTWLKHKYCDVVYNGKIKHLKHYSILVVN